MRALASVILAALTFSAPMPSRAYAQDHTEVTAIGGPVSAWAATTGNSMSFTVENTSGDWEWYGLSCTKISPVSSCSPDETSLMLGPGSKDTVTVTFATAASTGTGKVYLTATSYYYPLCEEFECPPDEGTGLHNVSVTAGPPPTVNVTINSLDRRNYGQCIESCFAAVYAQGTVPYFAMGTARNVTLVYNSDRTTLRPFVHADVYHGNPGYAPTEYRLQVKVNGALVIFWNGQQTLTFSYPGQWWHRIGGQFDATSYGTGVHKLEVLVTSVFPNASTQTSVTTTRLAVLDERSSYVARGWTIGGLQRLHSQGDTLVLIAEGDGSHTTFVKVGANYIRPAGDFSQLRVQGGTHKYVRTYPDSTQALFGTTGLLLQVKDRFGNQIDFSYDGSSRLSTINDQYIVQTLTYGANGLSSVSDQTDRYTYVTVNGSKHLTVIKDPDGDSTRFAYDGSQRLDAITDRRGHTSTLAYNDTTQLLKTVSSPSVAVAGSGNQYLTTTFDPWQRDGVPYVSTSSGSPFPPVAIDSVDGRVIDPSGREVRYRWPTPHGQAVYTHLPYGNVVTHTFNSDGLVISAIDPFGPDGTYQYDSWGKLTSSSEEGVDKSFTYGNWSLPDSIWGEGIVRQKFYASGGKVDSIRSGESGDYSWMRFRYDSQGRDTMVTDGMGHLVRKRWYSQDWGNVLKDSMPGARTTSLGYDGYGRVRWTERTGAPRDSVIYDVMNRPIETYDGVYATPTVLEYDALYLASVTDAKGQEYEFEYDPTGALVTRTDPANNSETYAYGWNRELRAYTNRRGQTVAFAYDSLLRRTTRSGDNFATDSLRYSASGLGMKGFSAVSVDSATANEFGQPDKLQTVFSAFGGLQYWRNYSYNSDQRMFKVESGPGVSFTTRMYGWWGNGTLFEIDFGGQDTRLRYNADPQADSVLLPDGKTIEQAYTSTHALARWTVDAAYGTTTDRELTFDNLNRLTHQERYWNKVHRYAYDDLGRLTRDTSFTWTSPSCGFQEDYGLVCTGGQSIDSVRSFSYDSVGNRTDLSGTYGTGNRIQSFDGCNYQTDDDGNVTLRTCGTDTTAFEWDALNRLVEFTTGGTTVTLAYNAFDQLSYRSAGTMSTGAEYYLWDRGNLYAILNSSGTVRAEYSYYPGLDRLHAIKVGSNTYYAHNDGPGNVIALTNTSAQLKRTYTYDNWGNAGTGWDGASLGDVDRARFKGAMWLGEELDVYYMRSRWYEPRTGRFLSEDPIGLKGGINLYAFAGGDPINGRDPTGLEVCIDQSQGQEHADSLRKALEDVTNTDIVLDENGCIKSATARSGNPAYGELQAFLNALIGDPQKVMVRFREPAVGFEDGWTKSVSWFGSNPWDIGLGWNNRQSYVRADRPHVRLFGGWICLGFRRRGSLAAHAAHEVLGHAGGRVRPTPQNPGIERGAQYVENLYHSAVGEPLRAC